MKTRVNIYLLGLLLTVNACQVAVKTRSSASSSYQEDLSTLRPVVEDIRNDSTGTDTLPPEDLVLLEPTNHINVFLDSILDSISIADQRQRFYQGYTILLYTGSSREQATMARGKTVAMELDLEPELVYNQPNYKVKVGKFLTRLEAQPFYTKLKKEFDNAIVAPERIYIEN